MIKSAHKNKKTLNYTHTPRNCENLHNERLRDKDIRMLNKLKQNKNKKV